MCKPFCPKEAIEAMQKDSLEVRLARLRKIGILDENNKLIEPDWGDKLPYTWMPGDDKE